LPRVFSSKQIHVRNIDASELHVFRNTEKVNLVMASVTSISVTVLKLFLSDIRSCGSVRCWDDIVMAGRQWRATLLHETGRWVRSQSIQAWSLDMRCSYSDAAGLYYNFLVFLQIVLQFRGTTTMFGRPKHLFPSPAFWIQLTLTSYFTFISGSYDYRVYITDMCRLTTGIRSEKCVVRRFRRCANVIECTYTNIDNIAYYIPRLYGIAYCS
jgi:hypothetical protein